MSEIILKEEAYAAVGAAIEVHKELGPGFAEPVYQEAMELELKSRGIPAEPQKELAIYYKGQKLSKKYVPDFVVFDKITVELKALSCLTSQEDAQVLKYLKATGMRLGILINFGSHGRLEWKRLVR
ncbi:MAG: GxxExxY protein [Planctomycetes bacterium]|nr:GxxExxY protein [Planctomycetota bacterium]